MNRATRTRAVAIALALAVVAFACGNDDGGDPAATGGEPEEAATSATAATGGTLTFGAVTVPPSLNPAIGDPAFGALYQWAYDPLVVLQPDGTFTAGLATEWGYVGEGNREYELTLREGVKFSDGTDLDAEAVKTYLEYQQAQPTSLAQLLVNVESIEVTGPLSLRLLLAESDPGLTWAFAQAFGGGNIASPAAVANPESLDLGTAGAGPYMLDPDETVPNDHYTFVPNPYYWDPDRVHWEEVVVRLIPNSSSMIEAIRAGQVQAGQGDPTTLAAAEEAGITVISVPQALVGLNLADRGGQVSEPLGDVRVRRALNHAIDREAIAAALYEDADLALSQYALEGHAGYDASLSDANAYDPDLATQLLVEAGYGDGLTIEVVDTTVVGLHTVVEAISAQLAEVGVTLDITTSPDANDYFTAMTSGEVPAPVMAYGLANMETLHVGFVDPQGPFNPFGTVDPELDKLYAEYFAAGEDESSQAQQRINAHLVDQAWALPVVGAPLAYYLAEGLTGIEATTANAGVPTLADIQPSG